MGRWPHKKGDQNEHKTNIRINHYRDERKQKLYGNRLLRLHSNHPQGMTKQQVEQLMASQGLAGDMGYLGALDYLQNWAAA